MTDDTFQNLGKVGLYSKSGKTRGHYVILTKVKTSNISCNTKRQITIRIPKGMRFYSICLVLTDKLLL